MQIEEREDLPDAWLELTADRLHEVVDGPTLIHLAGRRQPALFVSVLMHGNEPAGWDAIRLLLRSWRERGRELPRSLSLLIGNVQAARHDLRRLHDQPDFNRIWPGTETPDLPEARAMADVVERMRTRGLFASVDIHNNTGLNPHYACVSRIACEDLFLASLFGRTIVFFRRPRGIQSIAMSPYAPSLTLECGKSGQAFGAEHAAQFLDACLHLAEFPNHPPPQHDLQLFHTVAIVKVPPELSFSFSPEEVHLQFEPRIDHMNFRELPPGTRIAKANTRLEPPLLVTDELGQPVYDDYFERVDDGIYTRVAVMPSMLTLNHTNIRQDCLCYLMERIHLDPGEIKPRAELDSAVELID